MAGIKRLNWIVLSIMTAITVLNMGLALNFVAASGQALAAIFSSQGVFVFAGVELAVVLLLYIFYKQRAFPTQA